MRRARLPRRAAIVLQSERSRSRARDRPAIGRAAHPIGGRAPGRPRWRALIKRELRQQVRERLAKIPPDEMHALSRKACENLIAHRAYRKAEVVLLFLAGAGEVDTTPLALQCWADAKRVLAPKVSWEQRRMIPIEIRSLTSDVRPSVMGLREPIEGLPFPVADIDLMVVPGIAFDSEGYRIGRGRGFYERFLAHPDRHATVCGLALEAQFFEHVPHDETDVRVDLLATDKCVRVFAEPRA
ncbi:MAG: 5-formyltetrahydrofolate cyclo-ligase [Planctomycetota bacterium]|nr:MAG: 5-formyltetrahydrofolate cyclo-ligase [Planctomycetota bacterium]